MRPFLPVLSFVVVSFLLLAAWIDYSNPDYALRPLLYLARLGAWIIALSIATVVFLRTILQGRLSVDRSPMKQACRDGDAGAEERGNC